MLLLPCQLPDLFSFSDPPTPQLLLQPLLPYFPKIWAKLRAFVLAIPPAWNALPLNILPSLASLSQDTLVGFLNCTSPSEVAALPAPSCSHSIAPWNVLNVVLTVFPTPVERELYKDKEFCMLLIFTYLWLTGYLLTYYLSSIKILSFTLVRVIPGLGIYLGFGFDTL